MRDVYTDKCYTHNVPLQRTFSRHYAVQVLGFTCVLRWGHKRTMPKPN